MLMWRPKRQAPPREGTSGPYSDRRRRSECHGNGTGQHTCQPRTEDPWNSLSLQSSKPELSGGSAVPWSSVQCTLQCRPLSSLEAPGKLWPAYAAQTWYSPWKMWLEFHLPSGSRYTAARIAYRRPQGIGKEQCRLWLSPWPSAAATRRGPGSGARSRRLPPGLSHRRGSEATHLKLTTGIQELPTARTAGQCAEAASLRSVISRRRILPRVPLGSKRTTDGPATP
mmetsp:Transcript_30580/g.54662  ORF Transcript_30580/g.54662 Transcript_30580/m.54662 type:complete len:226 (-) Transcript_30580:120-797(-)